MSGTDGPSERQCVRCGHTTTPRGAATPRYCAVCGLRFAPTQATIGQLPHQPGGHVTGPAMWALILGGLSLIPVCGAPLGIIAIGLGLWGNYLVRESNGRLIGAGAAAAGAVLGFLGLILQLAMCNAGL